MNYQFIFCLTHYLLFMSVFFVRVYTRINETLQKTNVQATLKKDTYITHKFQFNSIQFALFIYTQYIYSVNMGSNRDYNRKV